MTKNRFVAEVTFKGYPKGNKKLADPVGVLLAPHHMLRILMSPFWDLAFQTDRRTETN